MTAATPGAVRVRSYKLWWIAGASAIAALLVLVYFFSWNMLRRPLEAFLSEKLDRTVTIGGNVWVKVGWQPWIYIERVAVSNAAWSDIPSIFTVEQAALRIELLSFFGRLRIPEMTLSSPRLVIESGAQGESNWKTGEEVPTLPLVGIVRIEDGVVRYRDPALHADLSVHVLTLPDRGTQEGALAFAGAGVVRGEKLRIAGQGAGLTALRRVAVPYALVMNARAGDTEIWFDGVVTPNDTDEVHGFLKLVGQDMSQLYPFVPAAIPWTPPYTLTGELTHDAGRWTFDKLRGTVGASDLAGNITIDATRPRRRVTADLQSHRLDYRDLGGFVGLPPGKQGTRANVVSQKRAAQRLAATGRIFSEEPYSLGRLREFDADVRFRGKTVRVDKVPIDFIDAHLVAENGVLRMEPLKIGLADGQLTTTGVLDANREIAKLDVKVEARNLDLKRIFPELASPRGKAGRFGGYLNVRSTGNSVAKMASAAQGQGGLIMLGGEASTLALVLTNLDLAGAVPLILGGDKTASLHCAAASYAIDDGVVVPTLLVVDTSAVSIDGEGSIDLQTERYDLRLQAKSKKFSIFALRGPVAIGGTLKNPTVGPTVAPIVARLGAAAGLAAVAPPLALLPFIDPGGAQDIDCGALIKGKAVQATG